jgi:lipoprotein-releasing system permease protein
MSSMITMIGVGIGVGAVCLFLAAHNGFEREIRTRILGATSHITIFAVGTEDSFMRDPDSVMALSLTIPDVLGAAPFIYYKTGIQSRSTGDGIVVRGINLEQEATTGSLKESVVRGKYSFTVPPSPGDDSASRAKPIDGIMLGADLADRLGAGIGDPIILYSITDRSLSPTAMPKKGFFRVTGIFRTGFVEYDGQLAYLSIPSAQKLFNLGEVVTGVHLKVANIFDAESMAPIIQETLGDRYDVIPWNKLYASLFTWVELEKLVIYLVFALMIIIAAFSVISTLVMTALEKRSEIAALKTIGLNSASIRKIFVYNGLIVGIVGTLSGWALALTLVWAQNTFHILELPADVYFISYLPFDPQLMDFLYIGAGTMLMTFLAGLYPAFTAARQPVIEALRR